MTSMDDALAGLGRVPAHAYLVAVLLTGRAGYTLAGVPAPGIS
jgi:hypothetical protein